MTKRALVAWLLLGAAAVALLVWAYPRAQPFAPSDWRLTAAEARAIALERLRDLGDPIADAYVVTRLDSSPLLERRLQIESTTPAAEARLRASDLARRVHSWTVSVYAPGALANRWTYRARLALDGEVLALRLAVPDDEEAAGSPPSRDAADRFLSDQGFDLAAFAAPEVRSQQQRARTDTSYRYRALDPVLGERFPYGVEVGYAGGRLTGFQRWFEDPDEALLQEETQPFQFVGIGRNMTVLLLLPLVAVPFLRRYHAGELGVRRGLEIGAVVLALSVVVMVLTAAPFSEGSSAGLLTRGQLTAALTLWMVGFVFLPVALMTVLCWSVGESFGRSRWSDKLAAFDALLQGAWRNATVARACYRGVIAGALLTALLVAGGLALKRFGLPPVAAFEISAWWYSSQWVGVVLVTFFLIWAIYAELFGRLFLLPLLIDRLGVAGGAIAAAVIAGLVCWGPGVTVLSVPAMLTSSILAVGFLVLLFLRYDLLTSLTAAYFGTLLATTYPLLRANDSWLELQGAGALLVAALPMLVSLRSITGDEEFVYRYDDVPPHVRRIAERERQRVELETARRIQSSILPELPHELAGVQLAHSYLPATEVGGDFYDVMALEDGRLAVAVGDVAGHGVSSGLVMSMAKSALAVQVTFNPDVEAVFRTLNRMVFQSARKRLLTTLCYVLLDPRRRELRYASAGHLFPYRVDTRGGVQALESVSYPLGVRSDLEVSVRAARLEPGDQLVLFSDGVVEAQHRSDDEPFGFDRLEASLRRHASAGVTAVRDGILADLARFTGDGPRADDLTLLVLQVP